MNPLVHLHVHSVHSHRHSLLSIDALISEAKRRGHQAVALTDLDGVYGLVPFVQAAREAGLHSIIGADLVLNLPRLGAEKPGRVTLLARNDEGFCNLSRLISHHHLHGRTGVSSELLVTHAKGLTFLTGGQYGAIPRLLAMGCETEARAMLGVSQICPLEYLACVLATGQGYYEPRVYIEDARAFGATISLPCINRSDSNYTVEAGGVLRIGLSYLHGLGPAGVHALLDGREPGPYRNLLDLKRRSGLSRPELEILIRIGACDVMGVSRSGLMHQLSDLPKIKPTPGQLSLFLDLPPEPAADFGHYPLPMQQAIERELLGFTVTVPPLPKEVGALTLGEAKRLPRRSRVSVVAEVVSRFGTRTKQGDRMSFLTLSDRHEHCQAVLFPEAYRKWSRLSRRGTAALFHGVLELDGTEPMIIISEVESLYDRWGVS